MEKWGRKKEIRQKDDRIEKEWTNESMKEGRIQKRGKGNDQMNSVPWHILCFLADVYYEYACSYSSIGWNVYHRTRMRKPGNIWIL